MFLNVFTAREPEAEAPKTNGAYETIIVSTKGKVGAHHAQPPARAERAQRRADRRAQPRARPFRGRSRDRLHRHHRQRKGVRRRRRHQGDAQEDLRRGLWQRLPRAVRPYLELPQADHRRRRGLCARRRLRARHGLRHHPRRRHGRVRPARDHARHHARQWRHAAADARGRQGQGHGALPHRAAHECRGGRALQSGEPGGAGRRS